MAAVQIVEEEVFRVLVCLIIHQIYLIFIQYNFSMYILWVTLWYKCRQ